MTTTIAYTDVAGLAGTDLGYPDWVEITQQQVNTFADATGDHQWIHVDPERAKSGPFGGAIAHGYLTLSLGPYFLPKMWDVEGFAFGVNYGYERVRFPAPLPVDSRVRMRATLESVDDVPGGIQMKVTQTFEREGGEKPVCVAEQLVRLYTGG